ncbi:hypothetical protein VP01_335g12 [Puccinia sorghi]|uniref:Uncharacterized protein n=1 Tax=Puccinia sorghi TaxID=27349 RepID=A0A0L6UWZ1_9BASI|nr:hypothetical protein VP01_335g12 [Puccinia sorghi]
MEGITTRITTKTHTTTHLILASMHTGAMKVDQAQIPAKALKAPTGILSRVASGYKCQWSRPTKNVNEPGYRESCASNQKPPQDQIPMLAMLGCKQSHSTTLPETLETIHFPSPTENPAKNHVYTQEFKQVFVQSNIKAVLLDPSIEQYSQTISCRKHTVISPVVMIQRIIDSQTAAFQATNLLQGYNQNNNGALKGVISLIRGHLKNEKVFFGKFVSFLG